MGVDLLEVLKDYQHVLLVVAVGYGYMHLKKVQQAAREEAKEAEKEQHEAAKAEIHAALANGIGNLIDKKNQEQDARWMAALKNEFQAHEMREAESIRRVVHDFAEREFSRRGRR